MEAPDKIFVPTRFRLVDGLRVRESDSDEEYLRKDALLEWLNEYKDNPVITELQRGNIQELIEKIESL